MLQFYGTFSKSSLYVANQTPYGILVDIAERIAGSDEDFYDDEIVLDDTVALRDTHLDILLSIFLPCSTLTVKHSIFPVIYIYSSILLPG